ncbi:MAG: hypothetical protein ACT4PE_03050 [Candidatus Eiseniibacteriota bacterium]
MSEFRKDLDEEIARDVAALVAATDRGLPTVHETVRRSENRARTRAGSFPMATIRFFSMRPALSSAVVFVLAVAFVFGFPIPFERTVGHDVTLAVSGAELGQQELRAIAGEMKSQLGAESVRVEAEAGDAGTTYRLTASVDERSGGSARKAASAFAQALRSAGWDAAAEVTPRTERTSGSLYAFAADRVIRVSADGKSAAQIEQEIRDGLAAAGFGDAEVEVTDAGADRMAVKVKVEREGESGAAAAEDMPAIEITKDGHGLSGDQDRCEVQVKKVKDDSGVTNLIVDVTKDGSTTTAEVANSESMGDAELQAALQSQLDRAGIPVRIDVRNGEISVEAL